MDSETLRHAVMEVWENHPHLDRVFAPRLAEFAIATANDHDLGSTCNWLAHADVTLYGPPTATTTFAKLGQKLVTLLSQTGVPWMQKVCAGSPHGKFVYDASKYNISEEYMKELESNLGVGDILSHLGHTRALLLDLYSPIYLDSIW